MAMRENIRNIEEATNASLALQKKNAYELTKKEREKIELKELEFSVKELIRKEFEKYVFRIGSGYVVNFYSIERKNELLQSILNEYKQPSRIYI